MTPYIFAPKTASPEPPANEITALIKKADTDDLLTYEESKRLSEIMHGPTIFCGNTYRQNGWMWPIYIARQLQQYIVRFVNTTELYYATNPEALAEVLLEMDLAVCWISKLAPVWIRQWDDEVQE